MSDGTSATSPMGDDRHKPSGVGLGDTITATASSAANGEPITTPFSIDD